MPQIKIERIISCSSEDPAYPSENILSTDASKTWRCKTPREKTEKSIFVILQLEKASVITGIDIGNDHSAYVEVLVSRTGMDDEYKSLLVPSSLMNPMESRQSQNTNRVRMFTKDDFSKPECNEKWDRVKIVCLQLFNQHVPFGLSFVKLHTSDTIPATDKKQTDALIIRPKSPDVYQPGYLFSKRKELDLDEKLTGAAAIRDSMRNSGTSSPVCKPKLKNNDTPIRKGDGNTPENSPKPRNRNELLYNKDEEEPNERIDKLIEKKMKEIKKKEEEQAEKKKEDKKASDKKDSQKATYKDKNNLGSSKTNQNSDTPGTSKQNGDNIKEKDKHRDSTENKRKLGDAHDRTKKKKARPAVAKKPFYKLLEGVVFVISGIPNPDRSEIRAKALEMGAKYKPDWDSSCTHLICAFANTPKFNQVKGSGKIVKRNWIEECHSQRKRLPWRRYALDKNDKGDDSEEEIWEDTTPTLDNSDSSDGDNQDWSKDVSSLKNDEEVRLDIYDADTDEENIVQVK